MWCKEGSLWRPERKLYYNCAIPGVVAAQGGGGVLAIPDVEFLGAIQVAESDGSGLTSLSGSYTPPVNTDFIIGVVSGRNSGDAITGQAMTLDGNAMTAFITGWEANFDADTSAFWTSTISAGTLAFTRSAGVFTSLQLVAYAFRHAVGVGTPANASNSGSAGPAQVAITPTRPGSQILALTCNDTGVGDAGLTPVNVTERIDLQATGSGGSVTNTNHGGGTALVADTDPVTVGFSWASGTKRWEADAVEVLKATS